MLYHVTEPDVPIKNSLHTDCHVVVFQSTFRDISWFLCMHCIYRHFTKSVCLLHFDNLDVLINQYIVYPPIQNSDTMQAVHLDSKSLINPCVRLTAIATAWKMPLGRLTCTAGIPTGTQVTCIAGSDLTRIWPEPFLGQTDPESGSNWHEIWVQNVFLTQILGQSGLIFWSGLTQKWVWHQGTLSGSNLNLEFLECTHALCINIAWIVHVCMYMYT